MANEEQLRILEQGVNFWNTWREHNANILIDFRNAYLSERELSSINLIGADLSGANLSKSNLSGAKLTIANLSEANLTQAYLTKADIYKANLFGARLFQTRLTEAIMGWTILSFTDLSNTHEIETIIHEGPSEIGKETFIRSNGKIPEPFLRGCGLNEIDIEYMKLLIPGLNSEKVIDITYKINQLYVGEGISYYSCFISYSSKDQEFVKKLHGDLQNNGVRCWFDREDIKIGDAIRPTIDRQIRLRDKLLVILSENSIQSEYVGDEVEAALEEEQKSKRLVVFPIRLDETPLNTRDDWAAKIKRRRHIGDFSNWKDETNYKKAFERLLRDLKSAEG